MIKMGGGIKLLGPCIGWIEKTEDGGLHISCNDGGSGETTIEFSPESARRLSDAILGLAVNKEKAVHFKEASGSAAADHFFLALDDQEVTFGVSDDGSEPDDFPTIFIKPASAKDNYDALEIMMNEAQAIELRRRLDGHLRAIELRREIAKPRRINPPAKPKRSRAKAA